MLLRAALAGHFAEVALQVAVSEFFVQVGKKGDLLMPPVLCRL